MFDQKYRILVVTNDEETLKAVSRPLNTAGFVADNVTTVRQAWERLNHHKYDYGTVIIDHRLRDAQAMRLLLMIKGKLGLQHLPVVMLTTQNDTDYVIRAVSNGADHCVHSPHDRLVPALERVMDLQSA